jgi:hypothetical protein
MVDLMVGGMVDLFAFPVLVTEKWSNLRPAKSVEKVPGRTTLGAERDRSKEGAGSLFQSVGNASESSPGARLKMRACLAHHPLVCASHAAQKSKHGATNVYVA